MREVRAAAFLLEWSLHRHHHHHCYVLRLRHLLSFIVLFTLTLCLKASAYVISKMVVFHSSYWTLPERGQICNSQHVVRLHIVTCHTRRTHKADFHNLVVARKNDLVPRVLTGNVCHRYLAVRRDVCKQQPEVRAFDDLSYGSGLDMSYLDESRLNCEHVWILQGYLAAQLCSGVK
jgi:hypothetical protein